MSFKLGINNSKRILTVALLALAAWPIAARAQAPDAAKPATPPTPGTEQAVATGTVIRTESRIVLVDAVVTDKKGKYVPDLTQNDSRTIRGRPSAVQAMVRPPPRQAATLSGCPSSSAASY